MIFTDRPFITAADLDAIDGEFSSIARKEGILVDGSSDSLIAISILDAGGTLISRLASFGGTLNWVGIDSNNSATVITTGMTTTNRPRVVLSQLVVTEPNPTRRTLQRWVKYYVLFCFYRMVAIRRSGDDRFAVKTDMYDIEQSRQFRVLQSTGIPVVITPFPCPGAMWEYGSGIWGVDNVTQVDGGSSPDTINYDVSATWVNSQNYLSTTTQNGGESGGSLKITLPVEAGKTIKTDITSLNPPQGAVQSSLGLADGIIPVQKPTGWNVYVGRQGGPLFLQNSRPIAIGTTSYILAGNPILSGFVQNEGQPAQYNVTMQKMLWRS